MLLPPSLNIFLVFISIFMLLSLVEYFFSVGEGILTPKLSVKNQNVSPRKSSGIIIFRVQIPFFVATEEKSIFVNFSCALNRRKK